MPRCLLPTPVATLPSFALLIATLRHAAYALLPRDVDYCATPLRALRYAAPLATPPLRLPIFRFAIILLVICLLRYELSIALRCR